MKKKKITQEQAMKAYHEAEDAMYESDRLFAIAIPIMVLLLIIGLVISKI